MARSYTVRLEPNEHGGYTVFVPAMPSIVTEGESRADALANAREAIEVTVLDMMERGEPIPADLGELRLEQVQIAV
jgi:predicted RNase H-like HicB family nuclease